MAMEGYSAQERLSSQSQQKLDTLRDEFAKEFEAYKQAGKFSVVAVGSLARLEACKDSDLDYFIISDKGLKASHFEDGLGQIADVIERHVSKPPGDTGTFGRDAFESIDELISNIGGEYDRNVKFTRRMLFLLEGAWLFNQKKFSAYRKQLLERYIKERTGPSRLNYFFLNDIIRYYRTIATDYEYKVSEDGKQWGLRNIKLRFSRKLLYFSGLLVVGKTIKGTPAQRVKETGRLLDLTPVERVRELLPDDRARSILSKYETFLSRISNSSVRECLENVDRKNRDQDETYRELRELSHDFTLDLVEALEECSSSRRFRTALLF